MAIRPLRDRIGQRCAAGSWWLFLAIVLIVPLLVTTTSLRGQTPSALTMDAVSLPKLAAIMVLGGLALVAHLVAVIVDAARVRFHWIILLVVAFLTVACLSTITSISRSLSLFGDLQRNEGLAAYAAYALVFFLAVQLTTSTKRLRAVTTASVLSGTLVASYGLLQFLRLDPLSWPVSSFGARVFATFGNPDLLAGYLVFPFAAAIGLLVSETRASATFWLACAGVGTTGAALALTLVRGPWIGAVVVVVVMAFAVWRVGAPVPRVVRVAIGAGIAFVLLAAIGSSFSPQNRASVIERIASAFSGGDSYSVSARLLIWRTAADAALRRPLLGYGPDTFGYAFRQVAGATWWQNYGHVLYADSAHSIALQLWVTLGSFATAIYAALPTVSLTLTRSRAFGRSRDRSHLLASAAWAAVVGMIVMLLTQVTTPMVVVWLWLAMGILVATLATPLETVELPGKAVAAVLCVALIAYALVGVRWVYADSLRAQSTGERDYVVALTLLDRAIAANSLPQEYWRARGVLLDSTVWAAVGGGATAEQIRGLADSSVARHAAAVSHDPEDPLARTLHVHALNQRQQLIPDAAVADRAVSEGLELARRFPAMPDAFTELARAQLDAGLLVEAQLSAQKATELDPKFSYAWLTLGEARSAAGDRTGALGAFQEAVRLDPTDSDAAAQLERLRKTPDR